MSETGAAAMADETADDENPEGQERKMSSTPVQRDQFEVSLKGITNKPTGATYIPHPGAPYSGNMNLGQLGNVLPNGKDYRPHEVQMM